MYNDSSSNKEPITLSVLFVFDKTDYISMGYQPLSILLSCDVCVCVLFSFFLSLPPLLLSQHEQIHPVCNNNNNIHQILTFSAPTTSYLFSTTTITKPVKGNISFFFFFPFPFSLFFFLITTTLLLLPSSHQSPLLSPSFSYFLIYHPTHTPNPFIHLSHDTFPLNDRHSRTRSWLHCWQTPGS